MRKDARLVAITLHSGKVGAQVVALETHSCASSGARSQGQWR